MRNIVFILGLIMAFFFTQKSKAQSSQEIEQIGYLLSDALLYSEKYIIPATDAAVYQASSTWITSPKKQKLWSVNLGLHTNVFFVPKSDRSFQIQNQDFQFFQIENGTSAIVPTALGNGSYVYLIGNLGGDQVRLKTPKGIDQEAIAYPYLQGSVGLPYGFEFIARYSSKVKLKKGDYQVYGLGLKHNFSHYFPKVEAKKINLSVAAIYSKEDISFDFLDINTAYGNLGINNLNSLVDTYHFQLNASKEFDRFEIIGNLIVNSSSFEYLVKGERGAIEDVIPVQEVINGLLKRISRDKTNILGEISGRYQISKIYLQSSIAFGKFVNGNIGVQYQF
ncbi:hypothetical protein NAT47_05685 [Flavobacterium sp. HXWNR69]|uniref:Uncharacterized protein n=1 Tax=Flavobacterium fragile TaxID=2949085 RepID=A0ABT0TG81_9FLAO|nr:DUF6588 family protein [Flavobacterium sp. HXWNR69]MCL9769902.1 hypothetical protein [Flavobacterium sp. HXWNR69]